MPDLFDPLSIRGVTLRNRIGVSPMCQYSAIDGHPTDWHLVHLGGMAVGGAGLIIAEATGVLPEGRITPNCLGLWDETHIPGHRKLTRFIEAQGAVPAIQLAHAGRKGSRLPPWEQDPSLIEGRHLTEAEGAWPMPAPSVLKFEDQSPLPYEMTVGDIDAVIDAFASAAARAVAAGYRWIEVHGAHGYLANSFNSPISNIRRDAYGGSLENRCRFSIEVAAAIRAAIPDDVVLAYRLSYTDWEVGGWTLTDSEVLCTKLAAVGVDLFDISSGGSTLHAPIPVGPSYQVPGATAIRQATQRPVAAVGRITSPEQADDIIRNGRADLVLLGKELLRDPYWPIRAAAKLGRSAAARVPAQYILAFNRLGSFAMEPTDAPDYRTARRVADLNARTGG